MKYNDIHHMRKELRICLPEQLSTKVTFDYLPQKVHVVPAGRMLRHISALEMFDVPDVCHDPDEQNSQTNETYTCMKITPRQHFKIRAQCGCTLRPVSNFSKLLFLFMFIIYFMSCL